MGLFGGDPKPASTTTKPYDAQRHKLEYGFNEAKNIYQQGSDAGPYQGDTYAGLNGDQNAAIDRYQQYLRGPQTGQMQGALDGSALSNMQAGANYGSNAQGIFNQYGGSATAGIMSRVGAYNADPALQGSIDAAKNDVYRDLSQRQLPQIGLNAEVGGNANSSRAGVAAGVAMRGAGETAGNIDASMRENAYTRSLGAAQQDYFGGADTAMAANGQVGNALTTGANLAGAGLGYSNGVYQGALGAGSVRQQDQQNQYNNNMQQWGYQNGGYRNGLLNNYMSQVGGNQWGQTQSQGAPGSNLLGTIGAIGGTAIGAYFGGPMGASIGGSLGSQL